MALARQTELSQNWKWKRRESGANILDEIASSNWNHVRSMPSEIHVELLHLGQIPDPFKGANEHQVQCKLL
jgi:beta-mannosidase